MEFKTMRLQRDTLAVAEQGKQYKQLLNQERAARKAVEDIRKEKTTVVHDQTENYDDSEKKKQHEKERLQREIERRGKEAELERLRKPEKRRRKRWEFAAWGSYYVSNAKLGL
ncbi:hypothetical protein AO1008_05141 [Aspergillus oryzae 100-8]|uniref:Uncharacterized protein n=1 Tax=Aspergillus oryzae (strain 3.042) TaxID=1160506 RepID=I8TL45_ASPO3|nr:hypothetical protein Ao3042_09491 [Aspergillus oryzae 3.042]KDE78825.1 hypothetical protein AO1008_05141 [Aspergillus oryzae 100-8]|eukprot:EIT74528.1 hypothetical protein Ao3042_09491 [Aspergillus oryzae 3.042]